MHTSIEQLLKSIRRQLNKSFNSCLNYLLRVVQDWFKSIFRIKVQEPYPQPSGGQKIRRARGPAWSWPLHSYLRSVQMTIIWTANVYSCSYFQITTEPEWLWDRHPGSGDNRSSRGQMFRETGLRPKNPSSNQQRPHWLSHGRCAHPCLSTCWTSKVIIIFFHRYQPTI